MVILAAIKAHIQNRSSRTEITHHEPRFKRGFSLHKIQVINDDTVAIAPNEVYNLQELSQDEYIARTLSRYE